MEKKIKKEVILRPLGVQRWIPPPHEYAIGSGSAAGFQRVGMRFGGRQRRGLHANERGRDDSRGRPTMLPCPRSLRGESGPGLGRGRGGRWPGGRGARRTGVSSLSGGRGRAPAAPWVPSGSWRRGLRAEAAGAPSGGSGGLPDASGAGNGTVPPGALPKSWTSEAGGRGRGWMSKGTALVLGSEAMVADFQ